MTSLASRLDEIDLTSVELYQERGYPWAEWALLRRESPVYWYERAGVAPFWCITKHEDIQQISREPETFISSERLVIRAAGSGDGGGERSLAGDPESDRDGSARAWQVSGDDESPLFAAGDADS